MQRNSREWKVADVVGRTSIANVQRERERLLFSESRCTPVQWHVVPLLFQAELELGTFMTIFPKTNVLFFVQKLTIIFKK